MQKALTDTKPPQPKKEIPTIPINPPSKPAPKPTPTTTQQKPQNPMPKEIKLICDFLDELEGAAYRLRQGLYQQYGPVDYNYITDIELQFTTEQAKRLSFQENGEYIIIRPKQHLDDFSIIAEKVRSLGGEYISAGKESHFRIKRS